MNTPSINNALYDTLYEEWWSDESFMALLRTGIHPARLAYFRQILQTSGAGPQTSPQVLDIGCGGGFLAEAFAELGYQVTGIDRSDATLSIARRHATQQALDIHYEKGVAENLPIPPASMDVVCCCDVLEHVESLPQVVSEIARVLKPGGLFLFDTINRTPLSWLVAVKLAQDWRLTRVMPPNTHVWHQFIKPNDLQQLLGQQRLTLADISGLGPGVSPWAAVLALMRQKLGFSSYAQLGRDIRMVACKNQQIAYMGYARKQAG